MFACCVMTSWNYEGSASYTQFSTWRCNQATALELLPLKSVQCRDQAQEPPHRSLDNFCAVLLSTARHQQAIVFQNVGLPAAHRHVGARFTRELSRFIAFRTIPLRSFWLAARNLWWRCFLFRCVCLNGTDFEKWIVLATIH